MNMGGIPVGNQGVMSTSQRARMQQRQENQRRKQAEARRRSEQNDRERRRARERQRAIDAARASDARREEQALAERGRQYIAEDASRYRRRARAGIDNQIARLQEEREQFATQSFGVEE